MKSHKKAMCLVLSVTALTLLLSIPLACGPADESVQRELGNLPPAAPALQDRVTQSETDSQTASVVAVPPPTLAPLPVEYQGTPGVTSGSPQEEPEEEDAPNATPRPTATPNEDAPTPQPTVCVAWPTKEAGDPDTKCIVSFLPVTTPIYSKLGADIGYKVEDAEERAADEVARGVAKDTSETTVAGETIAVIARSRTLTDGPAIEDWLKARRISFTKRNTDTLTVYSIRRMPALLIGELSELEAIQSVKWNRPETAP